MAADLLAQAEHDPMAAAILITTSAKLAEAVANEVDRQLTGHPRQTLTEKSIANYGLAVVVDNLEVAASLSNEFAPEHLQLEVAEPWDVLEHIRHCRGHFSGPLYPRGYRRLSGRS